MTENPLNPRDWRDVQVLRAQGVLAEVLVVDLDEADQGMRAYATASGMSLYDVTRRVCARELIVERELCVAARRAGNAELLERATGAVESARKVLLRLADAADALAGTYDRIAAAREAGARDAGRPDPVGARVTRGRAEAERREADRFRRAAEALPGDHPATDDRTRSGRRRRP